MQRNMISEDFNSLDFHLKRHLNILGINKRGVERGGGEEDEETMTNNNNYNESLNAVKLTPVSAMVHLQQEVNTTGSLTSSKIQKYKHFLDDTDQVI
jgi:hypothetical protein